jgi:hypothetical protein
MLRLNIGVEGCGWILVKRVRVFWVLDVIRMNVSGWTIASELANQDLCMTGKFEFKSCECGAKIEIFLNADQYLETEG